MASGLAVGTRGMFRRMVWKGFRRRLRRGIRQGFRTASKGLIGRASGTHVIYRKGSEGVFRAGRFERVSEGGSFGEVFIIGLGINGWGWSASSDRPNGRS